MTKVRAKWMHEDHVNWPSTNAENVVQLKN